MSPLFVCLEKEKIGGITLEITLRIKGEFKTFTQEFVPLKIYRKALETEKKLQAKKVDEEKVFDDRLNLIVEIFDKQFTKDELENGLNAINHAEVMFNIIGVGVLGYRKIDDQEAMVGKLLEGLKENTSQLMNKSNE